MTTENIQTTQTTQTTQTAADPPVTSPYIDAATAMIGQIHAMQQLVPKLVLPAERNSTQRLASASSVPLPFIDKVSALVETKPLLTGTGISPDELRDKVAFASAFGPVPDELEALASAMRHTIREALNTAGSAALTAYEMAKRLSKRPETVDLLPHVADMKRLLGTRFPGKRKKAAKATPAPAPQPAPVPQPSPDPVKPTKSS